MSFWSHAPGHWCLIDTITIVVFFVFVVPSIVFWIYAAGLPIWGPKERGSRK